MHVYGCKYMYMYSLAFPVSIDTSIDVHVHDISILQQLSEQTLEHIIDEYRKIKRRKIVL